VVVPVGPEPPLVSAMLWITWAGSWRARPWILSTFVYTSLQYSLSCDSVGARWWKLGETVYREHCT